MAFESGRQLVDGEVPQTAILPKKRSPWLVGLVLSGVALGGGTACRSETPQSSIPSFTAPSQTRESKPTISVFEDMEFTKLLGEVAAYDIICVYRKDRANPSIQPHNVRAYYVDSTNPPEGPRGYVDPAHAGMVTGMSPECGTPPLPDSQVPTTSSPGPSVQA